MRLHLVAPFRTQFQIDTEFCLSDWDRTSGLIEAALATARTANGFTLSGPARRGRNGFQKYVTLATDHLSPFSTPLLTFEAPPAIREAFAGRYFDAFAGALGVDTPVLETLRILVYDNTVAMLAVTLALPAEGIDADAFVEAGDEFLVKACGALVSEVAAKEVETVVRMLVSELEMPARRKLGRHVVRHPRDFLAFDDVAFGGAYGWPADVEPVLWVNRTLELTQAEAGFLPVAGRWARLNGETEAILAQPTIELTQVGNSLFFNSDDVADYLSALCIIQYFYIIFDTFSDRLKRFYVEIAPWRDARSVSRIQRRASRISSFFGFAESEFADLMIGLQSERKIFARRIAQAYDLEVIIDNVREKNRAVDAKLHALIEVRGQARQKVLQFGIVLIGALQIFDLLLNVSWFARSEPHIVDDGVPGLFSLGLAVSPNLLQTLAFLVVLAVAFLIVARRRI